MNLIKLVLMAAQFWVLGVREAINIELLERRIHLSPVVDIDAMDSPPMIPEPSLIMGFPQGSRARTEIVVFSNVQLMFGNFGNNLCAPVSVMTTGSSWCP